jgi:uncharacterized RmlC-like cupin family protein
MTETRDPDCRVIRPGETYRGKQGFDYAAGISRESTGSRGLCMHLLELAPGQRAKAHLHENHETAIYALSGETEMWYGQRLERHLVLRAGEMLYIPAGMPHLPANVSGAPARVVIARTDPMEQESVVLLPDLDALVPGQA